MSVTRDEVLAVISRIATVELELGRPVSPGERLTGELELDSMGLTIMAVGLENHFRVRLDEGDAAPLETIDDVITLVLRRLEAERPADAEPAPRAPVTEGTSC
jgi:acyl carrier protein